MQKVENNFTFIDSQNLNLGIREQGWKLDLARFRRYLKENYAVTKTFLFMAKLEPKIMFLNDLKGKLELRGQ